jgi:hypothetical protein
MVEIRFGKRPNIHQESVQHKEFNEQIFLGVHRFAPNEDADAKVLRALYRNIGQSQKESPTLERRPTMSSIASVGGVGAGLSQAGIQVQYQAQVMKDQHTGTKALGTIALELMQSAMSVTNGGTQTHDLDVKA